MVLELVRHPEVRNGDSGLRSEGVVGSMPARCRRGCFVVAERWR